MASDFSSAEIHLGMELFTLGTLSSVRASLRPDLLAEPTHVMLARAGLLEQVGVVEIDPSLFTYCGYSPLVPRSAAVFRCSD